jgi:hypothetical protein
MNFDISEDMFERGLEEPGRDFLHAPCKWRTFQQCNPGAERLYTSITAQKASIAIVGRPTEYNMLAMDIPKI